MTSSTNIQQLYRRIRRRETHSPRSSLSIVLAIILILACAWAATEIILRFIGQPPLLLTMPALAQAVVDVPMYPAGAVIAVGVVAALVGIILILAAILPGRQARHVVSTEHSAAIVDNEVIASALARHAARAGNVDPDNARVSVSHRTAIVRLTPASGMPIDRAAVSEAVDRQLESYGLVGSLRSKVLIDESGKVGA